jgi:hypothetical protein
MKRLLSVLLLPALIVSAGFAQEKDWQKWSKADAEKILNNSGWSQIQSETDTTEMTYSPTSSGRSSIGTTNNARRTTDQQSINNNRADRGATNQPVSVNYHVRLLSAKPVRQAFMRSISIEQKTDPEVLEGMKAFVARDFKDFIVVAVTFDSPDSRFSGPALQAFATVRVGTLKNVTYLERKDGKRIQPIAYYPPINDGLGAKFVVPRNVDEQPFISLSSGNFRFYCELTSQIKLNVTYKISDLTYNGVLEY